MLILGMKFDSIKKTNKFILMRSDLYTKTVLTIIAICLTINIVTELEIIPSAYASEVIVSPLETSKYKLVPINESGTIDVRIVDIYTSDELNVNIKNIDTYDELKVNLNSIDTDDELDINIDEIGGLWVQSGGPIPVQIK